MPYLVHAANILRCRRSFYLSPHYHQTETASTFEFIDRYCYTEVSENKRSVVQAAGILQLSYLQNVDMDGGSDGQTRGHSFCLRRIVDMKLMDRHRLETIREQCGTSLLELMVRRRTLQWIGHLLRINEDPLPLQVFECSLARVAEDGRVEQLKLRQGHRNIKDFPGMYSSAIQECHEEGSGLSTTFRNFFKLPGHTKLLPWPEICSRPTVYRPATRSEQRQLNMPRTGRPAGSPPGWTYDMVLHSSWREWLMLCNPPWCATQLGLLQQLGSAVDPGPGLVNASLCNDCDLAEDDREVIARVVRAYLGSPAYFIYTYEYAAHRERYTLFAQVKRYGCRRWCLRISGP
eukprot:366512-Chlamydomonas_euryale.AAC.22